MASASADALRGAATNANGSMMGFMGMNMAGQAAGSMMSVANQGSDTAPYNPGNTQPEQGTLFGRVDTPVVDEPPIEEEKPVEEEVKEEKTEEPAGKECPNCHEPVTGKFCGNCGTKIEE